MGKALDKAKSEVNRAPTENTIINDATVSAQVQAASKLANAIIDSAENPRFRPLRSNDGTRVIPAAISPTAQNLIFNLGRNLPQLKSEEIDDYQGPKLTDVELRESANKALKNAQQYVDNDPIIQKLAPGARIIPFSGFRTYNEQGDGDGVWLAEKGKSHHHEGSSVDVVIKDRYGRVMSFRGSKETKRYKALRKQFKRRKRSSIESHEEEAYLEYRTLRKKAKVTKQLGIAMAKAGFVNYRIEGWHYEFFSSHAVEIYQKMGLIDQSLDPSDVAYGKEHAKIPGYPHESKSKRVS